MDRLKNIVQKTQSGPELFVAMDGEPITLGTLTYIHREMNHALEAAQVWAEESYDNSNADDAKDFLQNKLLIEYALDCLQVVCPWADKDKREFWLDRQNPKKITFTDPKGK